MKRNVAESVSLLRWVFQQRRRMVTCAIDAADDGASFDVSLVPHWNLSDTTIESFKTAASAFARHAEISLRLRQGGWALARQTPNAHANAA